jgi:hypothetical protein
MFHSAILAQYMYRRIECQALAIDALTDTAEFYGLAPMDVAQCLRSLGIDANRLALL